MASVAGSIIFYTIIGLALAIMVLYVIPIVFAYGFTGGSTFVPTSKHKIEKVLELVTMPPGSLMVDLGCGDGRFLVAAERQYSVDAVGYEINLTAFLLAKLNILFNRSRAKVYLKNFWKINLGEADYVICYLYPDALSSLKRKFDEELKPGCVVVSCDYLIEDWRSPEVISYPMKSKEEQIFIYRI
jgi:ribosomal protein L11 methylase PrmA